ncbi:InlB B-repeat-containing protein [uncultured Treponema sp.]|uniref:InlB B-repeat-containing protein n=1 Tax=uncultured Treponema sp. TaxID=162155 RepID=UPI0025CD4A0A|nr:InlB B-repeat-containing protein [uncultured Treponema sp.]
MKKNLMNFLKMKLLAVVGAAFLISSCSDGSRDFSETKSRASADGKTYLCISGMKISSDRSIAPATTDYAATKLTDIVLKGAVAGGTEQRLATAATYDLINEKLIPLSSAGSWSFTLTAKLNGASFTGEATKDITLGTTATIAFTLVADESFGGMSIKFTFTGTSTSASDYTVTAKLMSNDRTTTIETKEFTSAELTPNSNSSTNKTFYVTYSRAAADENSRLSTGTYYLLFEIYDTRNSDTVPLNTSRNFVRVDNGLTTTAALSLTLNDVYTITYYDDEGKLAEGVKILNYSRKSEAITLPTMEKEGYLFAGWYTNSEFTDESRVAENGENQQVIAGGTTGNLSLYAYFVNTIYVASSGLADNTGFSKTNALGSIASAVAKISDINDSSIDWNIAVDGTLTEAQTIEDPASGAISSITILGCNGIDSTTNEPKDSIEVTGADTALTISTSVPVTVRDIKITKGTTGHGVNVGSDSKIYLAGTPVIDDLYLESNAYDGTIFLADNLGSGASVTITPSCYETPDCSSNTDYELYKAKFVYVEEESDINIADNSKYFHITAEVDEDGEQTGTEWFIDDDGCLNKYVTLTFTGEGTASMSATKIPCKYFATASELPSIERDGYLFNGWYYKRTYETGNPAIGYTTVHEMTPLDFKEADYYDDDENTVTDSDYTFVNNNTTLYATWTCNSENIYVNASTGADYAYIDESTGADDTIKLGDGSSSAPYKSINCAVSSIKTIADSSKDYTILVTGFTDDFDITIDENVPATSITLQGAVATNEGEEPSCGISRSSFINDNPTTLSVSGGLHVTISNFKFDVTIQGDESDGAIINVSGSESSVTLDSGTLFKGNARTYGGALPPNGVIAVENGGTLVMKAGSSIDNYYIANGNVYVKEGGIFNMEGGTISNTGSIGQGGAVCVAGGNFNMSGGEISSNTTSIMKGTYGAGVTVKSGSFIMSGGEIKNNTAYIWATQAGLQTAGGGVFVYADGSFEMTGGTISGNKALNAEGATGTPESSMLAYGGGVCLQASGSKIASFTMTGGTISGNSAGTSGSGIGFIGSLDEGTTGTITIGKDALITPDNDVYLPSNVTITVDSALTGDDANPIKATITPQKYQSGLQILEAADGVNLETEYDYFAVTDEKLTSNTTYPWYLTEDGKLETTIDPASSGVIYVGTVGENEGNVDTGDGSRSKPFESIEKAVEIMNNSEKDYTILVGGTLIGAQSISGTINAKSITLEGLNGLDVSGEPQDVLNGGFTETSLGTTLTINAATVTIRNLEITGGSAENGGGINVSNFAHLTIQEGTLITGNYATTNGGGIYSNLSYFTMEGGTISSNSVTGNADGAGGGGICITGGLGTGISMSGGTITGNGSSNVGGGVYIGGNDSFEMTGGTITGNRATEGGSGVYVAELASGSGEYSLKMGGSAVIASDNDVYLSANTGNTYQPYKVIYILSSLTSETTPVATITPASYSTSTYVLSSSSTTSTEYSKFALTQPEDSTVTWRIMPNGVLWDKMGDKSSASAVGDIVFNDGTATAYSDNLKLSDAQKAAAVAVIFDTEKKLGVGLKTASSKKWCSENAVAYKSAEYATSEDDGAANTDAIAKINDYSEEYYPAFYFCTSYSVTGFESGWYLPAKKELQKVYDNREAVGNAFTALGRTSPFASTIYWSSTQYISDSSTHFAYLLVFDSGSWVDSSKYGSYECVCAIRAF